MGLPLTLLLIDDDRITQEIFDIVIASHGGRLFKVKDTESALNCIERYRPDIIVVDLYLDHVDGFKTLQLIQQSAFNPRCPIIATTAYHTPRTISLSLLSGFDGYLPKPFAAGHLWSYFERVTHAIPEQ